MKVDINYVRAYMVVDEPVYDKDKTTLLIQHGEIITPKMLVILKMKGIKEIAVAEPDSLYISPAVSIGETLYEFYKTTIFKIVSTHNEGNLNGYMATVAKHVCDLFKELTEDETIMGICVEIKLVDQHVFWDGAYCSTYAALISAAMGMTDEQVKEIAAAALISNLGLCEMPHLIGVEREKLSPQNLELWKEHPLYGYYFSKERGVSPNVSELIYCHHEQFSGTGYPRGLKLGEIPMGAKIIKFCEDYYTMIYKKNMPRKEVVEYFYSTADSTYDSQVIDAFIMNIPVYTLGGLVRLSNHEVGVVINIRKNMGPYPLVRASYNSLNKPFTQTKVYDLKRDPYTIIEVL